MRSSLQIGYLVIAAGISWFAVVSQLILLLKGHPAGALSAVITFISYYTILTNILLALFFTTLLLWPGTKAGRYFSRHTTATAITVYITVVGMIYNLLLRGLVTLTGLNIVVNELLHVFTPLLGIGYWVLYTKKMHTGYYVAIHWLIYPGIYMLYTLVRGSVTGWYPYPFINAGRLGYPRALLYCGGVAVVFLLVGWLFIWLGNQAARKKTS